MDLHAHPGDKKLGIGLRVLLDCEVQVQGHHCSHQNPIDHFMEQRIVIEPQVDDDKEYAIGQEEAGEGPIGVANRFAHLEHT